MTKKILTTLLGLGVFCCACQAQNKPDPSAVYEREIGAMKVKLAEAERDKMELTNQLTMAALKQSQLSNDLTAATSRESDLKQQVTNLSAQLDDANAQIAKLAPDAAKARQVPVRFGRRNTLLGGLVYDFLNSSGKPIRLDVTFQNGGISKRFTFVAEPGLVKSIGNGQGWQGASGDTVTVQSAGFDPISKNF